MNPADDYSMNFVNVFGWLSSGAEMTKDQTSDLEKVVIPRVRSPEQMSNAANNSRISGSISTRNNCLYGSTSPQDDPGPSHRDIPRQLQNRSGRETPNGPSAGGGMGIIEDDSCSDENNSANTHDNDQVASPTLSEAPALQQMPRPTVIRDRVDHDYQVVPFRHGFTTTENRDVNRSSLKSCLINGAACGTLVGVLGAINSGVGGFFLGLSICGIIGGCGSTAAVKLVNDEKSGVRNWTNKYTDISGWYEPQTDTFHREMTDGGGELIPINLWTPYKSCFG